MQNRRSTTRKGKGEVQQETGRKDRKGEREGRVERDREGGGAGKCGKRMGASESVN